MRMLYWSSAAVAAVMLSACGVIGGSKSDVAPREVPVGERWNATLATPSTLAGAVQVQGTGWLGAGPDRNTTRASVRITNATPGGLHPWHVHRGRCGADQGILGPPTSYGNLTVGSDGVATANVVVPQPYVTTGEFFVNVHASPSNLGTIIACGNLAPPMN
jgi:hypothetical protein